MKNYGIEHCPDVIVTAGGTREKIDNVRYIGNFSGGHLGHALATSYTEMGYGVLLLSSQQVIDRYGVPYGAESQVFSSSEDLRQKLLSKGGAGLILHAAAVSDYKPEYTAGKISSDKEELTIRLTHTSKILPELRVQYGAKTKIVGFKLLSEAEEPELIEAATNQIAVAQTDLCVANRLEDITPSGRRLHLVQPGGEYTTFEDKTIHVADAIAQAISVDWRPRVRV